MLKIQSLEERSTVQNHHHLNGTQNHRENEGLPREIMQNQEEEGLGPNTREQQPGDGGVPSMEHLCPTPASFPGGCDGWMDHLGARGSLCLMVFALLVLLCWGARPAEARPGCQVRGWLLTLLLGKEGHRSVTLLPGGG